jgi:hypothetical protein
MPNAGKHAAKLSTRRSWMPWSPLCIAFVNFTQAGVTLPGDCSRRGQVLYQVGAQCTSYTHGPFQPPALGQWLHSAGESYKVKEALHNNATSLQT